MPEYRRRTHLDHPPEQVWRWHDQAAAFERLSPPFQPAEIGEWAALEEGNVQRLYVKKGVTWAWHAKIEAVEPGRMFRDVQIRGPFKRWVHTHRFEPDDGGCLLEDHLDWQPPLGALGLAVTGRTIARDLDQVFRFRHARTQRDLDRHATFARSKRLVIAISGASGFIGSALTAFLTSGGHTVHPLVRRPVYRPDEIRWHPDREEIEADKLEGVDAVIHLAGEPIAQPWTEGNRRRIRDSRVIGTRLLSETLAELDDPPEVLIAASAVGYYGLRGDEVLDERSDPGEGFLAGVCQEWEQATGPAAAAGIRVVNVRTGLVLDPRGGLLAVMLPAYRLGAGGRIGDGTQWQPWIGRDDLVGIYHHALFDDTIEGAVNGVAPNPVPQKQFATTLADVLGRPTLLRLPQKELSWALGDMADEMLLASQRAYPERIMQSGFRFTQPHLERALRELLGRLEPE